jgi:ATP-dependent Clp protease protease subunit
MEVNSPEADKKQDKSSSKSGFIDEKLFKSRAITIFGEVNDKLAKSVTERLLALAADSDAPISIYISSPGGHVESGDVVYDMIKFIKPTVKVIGTGWVASAATTIYLAAAKENRFSLPNTRFLVHQPSGGRINQLIADETGQPLERVAQDTDRDFWMNAAEAIDYGIVSKIVKSVTEI